MTTPLKLQVARRLIERTWPYLSSAAYRLKLIEVNHPDVKTLAVDRYWRCYYNREWVEAQHLGTLAVAIAGHELWHLLHKHHDRAQGADPRPHNWAGDFAINSTIHEFARAGVDFRKSHGYEEVAITPGENWLYPLKTTPFNVAIGGPFPTGLLLEQYLALFKLPEGGGGGGGDDEGGVCQGSCGSSAGGPPRDYEDGPPTGGKDGPDGVTDAEARVIARGVAEAIRAHAAKYPGTVPGGLETWAEYELAPPKVSWRQVLRAKIRAAKQRVSGQVERTYSRRSRRTQARWRSAGRSRFILPGTMAPVPDIVVVLDTSGSMTDDDYAPALSEIREVIRLMGGQGVPVLCCDAAAYEVRIWKRVDRVLLEGGGGTDMPSGIAAAAELGAQIVVVATDGYTSWGDGPPDGVKVVACLTRQPDGFEVPKWAEAVYCGDDGS